MKYTDLKVGDVITILEKPYYWSSYCCHNSPLSYNVIYPFTGEIFKISKYFYSTAAKIGNYGFALEHVKFELFTAKEEIYDIY